MDDDSCRYCFLQNKKRQEKLATPLIGGDGNDTLAYTLSDTGVMVRLHSFHTSGGHAQGDAFGNTVTFTWTDADNNTQSATLPDFEHLAGSEHDDTLAGDARNNIITGNAGSDTLYGGPGGGDDVINGGPGNDALYGGLGADTLIGGPGDDRLTGGPDADVFVFGPGDGNDTIKGFNVSEDQIDLTAFNVPENFTLDLTTVGDDTVLNLASMNGDQVLFEDLTLDANDATFIV